MTPITHITPREQALMRENERLTDQVKRQSATIHVQAVAIQAMQAEIAASERNLEQLTDELAQSRAEIAKLKAQPVQPAADPKTLMDVTIDDDEALKFLRDMVAPPLLDGELTPVRIFLGDGHSGYGLYVAAAEYQDQGSWLLASVDAPVAQPVQELSKRLEESEDRLDRANDRTAAWRDIAIASDPVAQPEPMVTPYISQEHFDRVFPPEPQPVKQADDWEIRGKLTALKCWHRLTEAEADDLVVFTAMLTGAKP